MTAFSIYPMGQETAVITCLALATTAVALGCSDNTPPRSIPDAAKDGGQEDGAQTEAGQSPTCDGLTPLATRGEIASTPRADAEAEMLALEASGAFIAPTALYEQIRADLAAIRSAHPAMQSIRAWPSWLADIIFVRFDPEGREAVKRGAYSAWNCLNAYYWNASVDLEFIDFIDTAGVRTAGRYNGPSLAAEYARLPNVIHTEPNQYVNDNSDVCVTVEDARRFYIFDNGFPYDPESDCAAGCILHEYAGFEVNATEVTKLGSYYLDRNQSDPPPPPRWFADLAWCRKWL